MRLPRTASSLVIASSALVVAALAGGPAVAQANHRPALRTFEHDAVGAVPAGCNTPTGATAATVTDRLAYRSARSLQVQDVSATSITEIRCPTPAQAGVDLSFAVYPDQLAAGFQFSLIGQRENYTDQSKPVFHLNITPQGGLRWYDNAYWLTLAPTGTVPLDAWSRITVHVPRGQQAAYVSVNGRPVGQAGPWGVRKVIAITGLQFSSAGSASTGDDVLVDDVALAPPRGGAPRQAQVFRAGPPVTIAQSPTPVQMPNTAVTVTVHGQQQILMSYPAHTDASQSSGNVMAVSTDRGRTWTTAQDRNPMPDAPSYGLTRLRNGDVLAVDYHTYMVPGSDNRQAYVPTAISHDGGRTWTQRNGVMTAPEQMRNISTVTDRPGQPMGGFVLVHSVVEDRDGTLYQSGYGYYTNDKKYRQIVLTSTDEGLNWTLTATVGYDPSLSTDSHYEGYCEGAIERVADGSLVIVMRTGSYQPMYVSRSADNGRTWSTPQPLLAGRQKRTVPGIYPNLTLMGNGQLVLWVGRPGQAMLASPDGSGRSWTAPQEIDYLNDGNGATLRLDDDHLLVFGDRGANWSFPTPAPYLVWSRTVAVAGPGRGFRS